MAQGYFKAFSGYAYAVGYIGSKASNIDAIAAIYGRLWAMPTRHEK
jgi:hypothetical protein